MRRLAGAIVCLAALGIAACSKSDVDSAQNAVASALPGVASALPEFANTAGIYARVVARFTQIDPSSSLHVAVRVGNAGDVALSGAVRDAAIERRFVAAANGVRGVKHVTSSLTVDASLPNTQQSVTDFALEAQIRAKLVGEAGVNGVSVDVKARGGKVTLAGNVPSKSVADTLTTTAKSVRGVTSVESRLQVRE